MKRFFACLFLVLAIAPAFAVDDDAKDPSTWTPVKIPGRQPAPEFADITAWHPTPVTQLYVFGL